MSKNKSLIISAIILLPVLFINVFQAQPRLSDFDFGSASVLPFFTQNNKKYFILSREASGKPESKGTYDDFGGSREPDEKHPLWTAAHEFFEEALLECIGFSLKETRQFIDLKGINTHHVIAFARNVAYITDFTAHIHKFFNNFYTTRHKYALLYDTHKAQEHMPMTPQEKRKWHIKRKYLSARIEKDRLAIVEYDTLKNTISQSQRSTGVTVQAQVLNPHNLQWNTEHITLRPYFVKKLRPFFMNKSYQPGMNKKIRFYDEIPTSIPSTTTVPQSQKSWLRRAWNWITFQNS